MFPNDMELVADFHSPMGEKTYNECARVNLIANRDQERKAFKIYLDRFYRKVDFNVWVSVKDSIIVYLYRQEEGFGRDDSYFAISRFDDDFFNRLTEVKS